MTTNIEPTKPQSLHITECREGRHTHYFLSDGRNRRPVELEQAHALRLSGVPMVQSQTRLLAAKDGE